MVPSSVEVGDEEVAGVRAVVCVPQLCMREHGAEPRISRGGDGTVQAFRTS